MRGLAAKAEALNKARKEVDVIKARHDRELEAHFGKIARLKTEVLAGLKLVGLSSVKLRDGNSYAKTKTTRFEILNPLAFEGWARAKKYTIVDRALAKQRLQNLAQKNALPAFAKAIPGETISYRSKKPAKKKSA